MSPPATGKATLELMRSMVGSVAEGQGETIPMEGKIIAAQAAGLRDAAAGLVLIRFGDPRTLLSSQHPRTVRNPGACQIPTVALSR